MWTQNEADQESDKDADWLVQNLMSASIQTTLNSRNVKHEEKKITNSHQSHDSYGEYKITRTPGQTRGGIWLHKCG